MHHIPQFFFFGWNFTSNALVSQKVYVSDGEYFKSNWTNDILCPLEDCQAPYRLQVQKVWSGIPTFYFIKMLISDLKHCKYQCHFWWWNKHSIKCCPLDGRWRRKTGPGIKVTQCRPPTLYRDDLHRKLKCSRAISELSSNKVVWLILHCSFKKDFREPLGCFNSCRVGVFKE